MLTLAEMESMHEDTSGVRVRRVTQVEGGGQEVHETWGSFRRAPTEELEGDVPIWDRITTLRIPTGPIPDLKNGQRIETQQQDEGAAWTEWEIARVGDADLHGDEFLLQLSRVE